MKTLLSRLHRASVLFAMWGWPILLLDLALKAYDRPERWADALNTAAFLWVVCAPVWPITLLADRAARERAMARLCGLKEDDERERAVTGEAARATLLLSLALQSVLLALSLTSVEVSFDPSAKARGEKGGVLSVGLGFSSSKHLDASGSVPARAPEPLDGWRWGGYVIAPSSFPVLALLMLIQLAAFRAYAGRRYEGADA